MLSSALVLACALLLRRASAREGRKQADLVAAGMASGFLGDLIMARVIPLPEHVLWGMLAFGAGHICYIRAFLRRAPESGGTSAKVRWAALGAGWLIGLLGWWTLVRNPKISPALNYGALTYGLLLSSMSGLAAALAAQDRRCTPVAIGGTLFLASDMLLASELFRGTHFPQIGDVVWVMYVSGQALIVGGMGMSCDENREPRTGRAIGSWFSVLGSWPTGTRSAPGRTTRTSAPRRRSG
jgi:uncharacterized membrane protein YhhN